MALRKKLNEKDVKISVKRSERLAKELLAGKTTVRLPGKRTEPLSLIFDEKDTEALLGQIEGFLENDLQKMLQSMIDSSAPLLLKSLRKRWPRERGYQVRELGRFRERLAERWWIGLNKLRMLVTMSRDIGNEVNQETRTGQPEANAALVDVLTRLHARSCQVVEEVIALMEHGFANGALARWRTLHEITVTAAFISDEGTDCAQRYIDHEVIESHRAALEYEEVRNALDYAAIPADELESIRNRRDAMVVKYGSAFGGPYGWAAQALGMKKPTFKDVEKAVGSGTMRGHYRMASHGVHANPKGIYFSMASMFPLEVLLTGPSNAGLADAGAATARSLVRVTTTLLALSQSMDYQVALKSMMLLEEEIGPAFLRAHRKLEREEGEIREARASIPTLLAQSGVGEDALSDFFVSLNGERPPPARKRRAVRQSHANPLS